MVWLGKNSENMEHNYSIGAIIMFLKSIYFRCNKVNQS